MCSDSHTAHSSIRLGYVGVRQRAEVGEGSWGTTVKSYHILMLCTTWNPLGLTKMFLFILKVFKYPMYGKSSISNVHLQS